MIENLPAMQETRVLSLGREGPLEKGMAIHSRILAWRIPRTEEPGRLQSMGSQESEMSEQLSTHSHMLNILVTQLLRHGFGIKQTLYFSSDCTEMYSS